MNFQNQFTGGVISVETSTSQSYYFFTDNSKYFSNYRMLMYMYLKSIFKNLILKILIYKYL